MNEFDEYSNSLLEQSKRFLELAKSKKVVVDQNAFLNASLLISISSLEAYINGIVDDFSESPNFTMFEIAFLTEKEIELNNGSFRISKRLKMSRLLDRIEILFQKFTQNKFTKENEWWGSLNEGIKLRNSIVHPKENKTLKIKDVERTLKSVINCLNSLFKEIYGKGLPSIHMELVSKLDF
jgi:HEPN superfamily RiboL-PSP-like protein